MTVLLVLTTFLVFIVLDYLINRKQAVVTAPAGSRPAPSRAATEMIDGFLVPEDLSYHPGHAWLTRERKHVARVGADELAATLLGRINRIELPKPGQWIRQGQPVATFHRDGETTSMVSPTEGEVLAVNTELLQDPALLRSDPYGKGWLVTVNGPDEESTYRNLIPKSLVPEWMRDAVERLYARQPALAGAVAATGGRPVEDPVGSLPDANWKEITAEFFLTGEAL